MWSSNEEEHKETIQLINERLSMDNQSDSGIEDDSPIRHLINKHSREIRTALVSTMLLTWAILMLPYDISGSLIHGHIVFDLSMFKIALAMWLTGHCAVIISSALSLLTLKFCKNAHFIPKIQLILIVMATCLQIVGAVLFSYSYCINISESDHNKTWDTCVAKSYGLYLLYNSAFSMYSGFIIFAQTFGGSFPIFAIRICNDDNEPQKFTKNVRIMYLSLVSFLGMILILVYGFHIYTDVDASWQAIYVGYSFLLTGTALVIISQLIFHSKCAKNTDKRKNSFVANGNGAVAITSRGSIKRKKNRRCKRRCEHVFHIAVYFLLFAGIVLSFIYSVVSKIPEAVDNVQGMRLIGNMIEITGIAFVICFEVFAQKDNYDDRERMEHEYETIQDWGDIQQL